MSTSEHNLTQDEQILHHGAAMLKKDLAAYHSCVLRDETAWKDKFQKLLVFCILAINVYYLSQVSF
jgi:hypothetical protein